MGKILNQAKQWFKARDTPIDQTFSDDKGPYAFKVTVRDTQFIVTAKKYLFKGQASFMEGKVVQRAIDSDALLLQFVADGNYRYVFDPAAVKDHGDPSDPDESARASQGKRWLDVPVSMGVSFDDWADGHAAPKRHPDDVDRQTSADGGRRYAGITDFIDGDGDD